MHFSLKKLIRDGAVPGGKFIWHNLYGAPASYSGKMCDLMNQNPEMGSERKGRILLHIESKEAKHPERKSCTLDENIKQQAVSLGLFDEVEYEVIAEVGMGIALPSNSSQYKVKIKIGDFEMETDWPKEYKTAYNRWSERFPK